MDTMTVVYTIADGKKFDTEEWPHIRALFTPEPHEGKPYRVHALSRNDEMRRGGLIEEALDRYGETSEAAETIREIIDCPDLNKWNWK